MVPNAELPAPPRRVALPQAPQPVTSPSDPPPGPHLRQVLVCHGEDAQPERDLTSRLRASKPVTWRGRGDLAQVPWAPTVRGTWLVYMVGAGPLGRLLRLVHRPPPNGATFLWTGSGVR